MLVQLRCAASTFSRLHCSTVRAGIRGVEYCLHFPFELMTHPELVKKLLKPSYEVWRDITPTMANLIHLAIGVSGEAGELLDAVKKAAIYRLPLDRGNILEELGDLEFYLEGLRQHFGVLREEILAGNIAKLQKRYADGYSDKAAHERADKL